MTPSLSVSRTTGSSRKQQGNALLYTLLALVLGGIGLAVGVNQYQEAERATSVQASVGEINSIIGAAKQNFGQYNYAGLTTAAAVGSQVIPAGMATSATVAANKFGGAVTLVDHNLTTPGTALLSYAGVPAEVCTNIVNGTQALARRIQVAAADVKPLNGSVDIGDLTTQCTSAATVTIAWTIGRT
ncbi:MAG: type 4 pilus major pilin [Pseudomonadota bacterium]